MAFFPSSVSVYRYISTPYSPMNMINYDLIETEEQEKLRLENESLHERVVELEKKLERCRKQWVEDWRRRTVPWPTSMKSLSTSSMTNMASNESTPQAKKTKATCQCFPAPQKNIRLKFQYVLLRWGVIRLRCMGVPYSALRKRLDKKDKDWMKGIDEDVIRMNLLDIAEETGYFDNVHTIYIGEDVTPSLHAQLYQYSYFWKPLYFLFGRIIIE